MANVAAYWKQVTELAATLPQDVPIISIENPTIGTHAGSICVASRMVAAQRMVERTHVRATDEQYQEFLARQTEAVKLAQDRDNRRAPKTVLVVGQEQVQQMVPALAEQTAAKSKKSA